MGALIVLILLAIVFVAWLLVRLIIWIIKTAVKEALREYDKEKESRHGSQ